MSDEEELIIDIYNAFNPARPLEANDRFYVDCSEVRGDENIFRELGRKIIFSDESTCQLYTGHRGVGKSTELLRLKDYLEKNHCFVVYFQADQEDIDSEDTQYTDILLACTRHLLEDLEGCANSDPLINWLKSRWESLRQLGLTEVAFEGGNLQVNIPLFAKITANLRASPSTRQKIREQLDAHTVSLTEALNQFIKEAKGKLPDQKSKLVVIADNLDRIARVKREDGDTNHEEIFIDRCNQLKALDCHIIYTIPISLLYSSAATDLQDNYSDPQVLPMIMVRTPEEEVHQLGLDKLKEMIAKRVHEFAPTKDLETEIFDSLETLNRLCLMSGGHVRQLMRFVRTALQEIDNLPISAKSVQRAITKARNTYRLGVEDNDWEKLVQASLTKQVRNQDEYRSLLFSRYLLEYRYLTPEGEIKRWHDTHPLLKDVEEFQEALKKVEANESQS